MAIDIKHLHHFYTVAELGSFSKAAESFQLTQPALSRSIKTLEESIGAPLLDRARGDIVPTAMGRVVLAHARQISANMDDLERDIALTKGMELGELRIGVGPFGGMALVGPVVGRLNKLHPKLRFDIVLAPWQELPERLRGRDLDLVVSALTQVQQHEDFEISALAAHPYVTVCRPGHPLHNRSTVSVDELLAFPWVGPSLPAGTMDELFSSIPPSQRDQVRRTGIFAIRCDSSAVLKDALLNSDAVSMMPRFVVANDITLRQLAVINGPDLAVRTRYGVAWIRHRKLQELGLRFIEMLHAYDREISN
jgi:DNA-binding transcriptional LysR family regulator